MHRPRILFLAVLACLLAIPAWAESNRREKPQETYKVKKVAGVKYFEGEGADAERHLLDLYLPKGVKKFPVLMWVHGGGWRKGSKEQGAATIERFAALGVGVATVNYRLAPDVKHPDQIEDVARAFAWVHKHIKKHGGNGRRLFVGGISAGGHLSALLALDPQYLKAHDLDPAKHIAGAVPVSGVYKLDVRVPLLNGMVRDAFGNDKAVQKEASPVHQVGEGEPPFHILYAQHDFIPNRRQAKDLQQKLKDAKNDVYLEKVPEVGHMTILKNLGQEGNATTGRLIEFIRKHAP